MVDVLCATDINKWRGKHHVLNNISLAVRRGEILTLLGPNGSGKSTLIAVLSGLIAPDTGAVRWHDADLSKLRRQAWGHFGIALQQRGLSPRLTVRELLVFFSLCYGGDREIDDLMRAFRLIEVQHRQTRHLSEGQKQRLSLSLAFLRTAPELLFLDEPMAGLDPESRRDVWGEIARVCERGTAVVCATHLTDEAEQHSNRVLILHAGQCLALDHPAALRQALPGQEKVEIKRRDRCMRDDLGAHPGVVAMLCTDHAVTLYCNSARQVLHDIMAHDHLLDVSCGAVSLEDAYLTLTHGGIVPCV